MSKINHLIPLLVLLVFLDSRALFSQDITYYYPLQNHEQIRKFSRTELLILDSDNLLSKSFLEFEDSVNTYLFNDYYWFFWKPSENEVRTDYCFELYSLRVSDKKIFKITNRNFFFTIDFLWQINTISNQLFILTTFNVEVDKQGQIGLLLIDQDMLKEGKYIPIRDSCGLESVKLEGDKILIDVQPYKRSFNFFSLFNFLFERYQVKKWNSEPYGNKWRYVLNKNFEIIDSFEITKNK